MDAFEAVRTRIEVKDFADRPVPRDLQIKVLEAGRMAPSAWNKQPWHFVLVDDKKELSDLAALAQTFAETGEPRGEIVLVIAPPAAQEQPSVDDAETLLRQALARVSLKDAVGEVALATGLSRRDLYQRALALAKEQDHRPAR